MQRHAMRCNNSTFAKQQEKKCRMNNYSAMATTAAPAMIAKNSRFRFVVIAPDVSVCRPGFAEEVVDAVGCTTVNMVTVLRSPFAMVVVLWYVEV